MRTSRLLTACALVTTAIVGAGVARAGTAMPNRLSPPPAGQSVSSAFEGPIPLGASVSGTCPQDTISSDKTTLALDIPAGFYGSGKSATAVFTITPDALTDAILTISRGNGTTDADAAGMGGAETVTLQNPEPGTYAIYVCASTPGPNSSYKGKVTLSTGDSTVVPPSPATPSVQAIPAASRGLGFSATVPADIQRNESEPNMEVAPDGRTYTCGPTGFSNADDYAQVSTDGGDQFHLIGQLPRGQQGSGGGGDCAFATSPVKNSKGNYNYAYAGLGPLTGFTTSTSDDNGRTLLTYGPNSNGTSGAGLLTDRQWMVFTDATTVLLSYNQQQPRNVVVQPSTNSGATYGTGVVAAPNPLFPGPLRMLPKAKNPFNTGKPLVYFPWNNSSQGVNVSVSPDGGTTWKDCRVAVAKGDPSAGFMTMDADRQGNLYIAWADKTSRSTYLSTLTNANIAGCDNPVVNSPTSPGTQPTNNPGWTTPVQVNSGEAATTLFPWLVAGGGTGRVAVAYYGTPSTGDPNTGAFKAAWDVYVAQSLDALQGAGAHVAQVKATTHPLHYDSICLNGLGCSLSTPAGDRSLGDFFAIGHDPVRDTISVVYDQSSKKPGEAVGRLATTAVLTQNAGPKLGGGTLGVTPARPALRTSSTDPTGDAESSYSALFVNPGPTNQPASDVTSVAVSAPATGDGFTVTMKIADLTSAKLQQAMTATGSASLQYIFRFVNGYTASAATAFYEPATATPWRFGFNDYTSGQCVGGNCQKYAGDQAIPGTVNTATGTITLTVPSAKLRALSGPTGAGLRPAEVPATTGSRFYDAAVFTTGSAATTSLAVNGQVSQSYLYPLDNSPAMDFLLPGPTPAGSLPEVPLPVVLPLVALLAAGGVFALRRRPRRTGDRVAA